MSFLKISDLPAATSAGATDQLETNQGGNSRRLTVAQVATHVRSGATDTLTAGAGSAAAPAISPSGDTNTGIFFPAADTIAFTEGGVEAMRIDAAGRVGIGTTSPGVTLDVRNPSGNCVISSQFGTGTKGEFTAASNQVDIKAYNGTNDVLTFTTGASERMRIDTSGNVGINNSAPGYRLDVGTTSGLNVIRVGGGNTGTDGGSAIYFSQAGATNVALGNASAILGSGYSADALLYATGNTRVFAGGSERMRIDTSGNVGINNSAPGYRLDVGTTSGLNVIRVGGGNTGTDGGSAIYFSQAGATNVALGNASAILGSGYSADALLYATGNTRVFAGGSERMRIDSAGNVGIGQTTPVGKLDVASSDQNIVISRSTGNYAAFQRIAPAGQLAYDFYTIGGAEAARITVVGGGTTIFSNGASATERARIDAAGNFLVGTTSAPGRVTAVNTTSIGVYGASTVNHGVFGDGGTTGFYGVYGASTNTSYGGVIGYHNSYNAFGILGYVGYGLYSNASIWVNGTVYTSDARLKENVTPLGNSLAKITALNPVSFDWKANSFRGPASDFGLIAQEVEQVIPECVFETAVPKRTPEMSHAPTLEEELGTYKGVDYSRFIPLLIAAVKELKSENNALTARVASLENK